MLSRLSAASAMPRARTPEASGPWMFTANDQRLCGVSTPPTNQPMMPLSASSEPEPVLPMKRTPFPEDSVMSRLTTAMSSAAKGREPLKRARRRPTCSRGEILSEDWSQNRVSPPEMSRLP